MLLRLGFAVSANAINPLSPPLRSPQQRPQGHPAKSKFLAVKVVSPDDVLHGELRRDPRPAVNPADTTSEAELKAEPLTFFHRVVDLGIPLRRAKASRSLVMPSIVILSLSQCHQVRGPYSGAGSANPCSRLSGLVFCAGSQWPAVSMPSVANEQKKDTQRSDLNFAMSIIIGELT